jgi:radical SAM protein with 4Fe4S-binding SPASM domain
LLRIGRARGSEHVSSTTLFNAYLTLIEKFASASTMPREERLLLYINRFLSGRSYLNEINCPYAHKPCGRQLIFMSCRGKIYPCSRAAGEEHEIGHAIGGKVQWKQPKVTLRTTTFDDEFSLACLVCKAKRICSFSCPAIDLQDPGAREIECDVVQKLMNYFTSHRETMERIGSAYGEVTS